MASSIPASVQSYLANCTPGQISAVLDAIRAVRPASQSIHSASQQTSELAAALQPKSAGRITKSNKGKLAKQSLMTPLVTKGRNFAANAAISKRPLNSFIAFRSYYSPIFSTQQQKEISGMINTLWHSDLSQAKWSILAKAYSIIRDYKGKEHAPLDVFLKWTAPHIGILSPDSYLTSVGWEIEDIAGTKTLKRHDVAMPGLVDSHNNSNVSVEDIITYCVSVGYISAVDMHSLGVANVNSSSMATGPAQLSGSFFAMTSNSANNGGMSNSQSIAIQPNLGIMSQYQSSTPALAGLPISSTQAGQMHAPGGFGTFSQFSHGQAQAESTSASPNPATNTGFSGTMSNEATTGHSDADISQLLSSAINSGVTMSQVQFNPQPTYTRATWKA